MIKPTEEEFMAGWFAGGYAALVLVLWVVYDAATFADALLGGLVFIGVGLLSAAVLISALTFIGYLWRAWRAR